MSDGKDTEVSHEKTITAYEVTKDAKELEKVVEYGEREKTGWVKDVKKQQKGPH